MMQNSPNGFSRPAKHRISIQKWVIVRWLGKIFDNLVGRKEVIRQYLSKYSGATTMSLLPFGVGGKSKKQSWLGCG
jgi:hypothetical protein